MLIVSLDQYIVVVALPEIGRALGYPEQSLQSVISGYAVASAGFLLLGGRAADLVGRRRILVAGLVVYAGASLAGGLATEPVFLLVARAAQGLGGALVFPATLSLVNTTFAEGASRNRAVAVWGGSLLERRSEIGLRRALGATKGNIRTQFLAEAILLSLIGGVIGIAVGVAATVIYAIAKDWSIVIPTVAWAGGFAAALLIGAVAGLMPALRAARMSPTQALWAT